MEIMNHPPKSDCCSAPSYRGLSSSGVAIMESMEQLNGDGISCGGSSTNPLAEYEQPGYRLSSYVKEFIRTDAGPVPVIKTTLGKDDLFSTFYVRCGIRRDRYKVAPGLYAVGRPDKASEVLVTANFKLTFDHLRNVLDGINAWILVLDTKGINVWCAAGKGTFATAELVHRIKASQLSKVVPHRRLIVPQLGATGVAARKVKEQSGFRVVYGPIRATDIPEFLKNKRKADTAMRQVTFTMYERMILTPIEIQIVLKPVLIFAVALLIISGLGPGFFSLTSAFERGTVAVWALVAGVFSGAFVTPVFLPQIPFRQFAVKGILTGCVTGFGVILMSTSSLGSMPGPVSAGLAVFLFCVALSSYLAMNFTGATPFTSPSGVEKEMKRFIPVQAGTLLASAALWIYAGF